MWKDSYRIGVDLIDKQHKQLFEMVGRLLDVVQNGTGDVRQECIAAITYLKNYTLQHFKDEEEYQKSINYRGFSEHVQVHERLVRDVLWHERKMTLSNFSKTDIKDFIGMLIAWLVCHVAGDDQLIVADARNGEPVKNHAAVDSFFYMSLCDILSKVTDQSMKNIRTIKLASGDFQPTISVKFNFRGDVSGTVTYNYVKNCAFNIMRSMASFTPRAIDELVLSAMMEISNISSVKSAGMMSTYGVLCQFHDSSVETLPAFVPSSNSLILDTGMGILEMDVDLS